MITTFDHWCMYFYVCKYACVIARNVYRAELSQDELLHGIQGQKRWEAEAYSSFLDDKRELISVQQQVVDSNWY